MRRVWTVVAVLAALAVIGAAGWAGWKAWNKKDDKPVVTLEFTPAEVVRPQRRPLPVMVTFSGPLVAPQTAIVRAKAVGTLTSLAVAEGDRVRAGQRLGTLELAELAPRVAERSAVVDAARARLAQAERSLAANQGLAAQGFISSNALDASRSAAEAARADLRAANAQVDTVRVAGRDAVLVAPMAGIVARRHVVPGEKLSPEQPVLTLVDIARLELAGAVGTHDVSRLAVGMAVQVRVEGIERAVEGRLLRIAPAAEAGTRSIPVVVGVNNPGERFRAGQYALGQVVLADDAPRLTLPDTAVGNAGGQDHVWLIEDGRLVRRAVTLGRRDAAAGRVELLQGVGDDAQVLAARFDNLREGAPAIVAGSPPLAAASTASTAAPAAMR